jgi:hypothetical protein
MTLLQKVVTHRCVVYNVWVAIITLFTFVGPALAEVTFDKHTGGWIGKVLIRAEHSGKCMAFSKAGQPIVEMTCNPNDEKQLWEARSHETIAYKGGQVTLGVLNLAIAFGAGLAGAPIDDLVIPMNDPSKPRQFIHTVETKDVCWKGPAKGPYETERGKLRRVIIKKGLPYVAFAKQGETDQEKKELGEDCKLGRGPYLFKIARPDNVKKKGPNWVKFRRSRARLQCVDTKTGTALQQPCENVTHQRFELIVPQEYKN